MAQGNAASAFHVYLFEQIALGNIDIIQKLLASGINVNTSDGSESQDTPLHWACSFNKLDVAIILFQNGASANVLNAYGQTPMHVLCQLAPQPNMDELVILLLQEGCNLSVKDNKDKIAVEYVKPTSKDMLLALESNTLPTMTHSNIYLEYRKELESRKEERGVGGSELLISPSKLMERKASGGASNTNAHNSVSSPSVKDGKSDCREEKSYPSAGVDNSGEGNVVTQLDFSETDSDSDDDIVVKPSNYVDNSALPQLVLWPPAQRQRRLNTTHLVLSNDTVLVVSYANSEILPLLSTCGLLSLLDANRFSMQMQKTSVGAVMRLSISPSICPGTHRYNLSIDSSHIELVGSDETGMLYGLYILVQLLQLHSERVFSKQVANSNSVSSASYGWGGANTVPVVSASSPDVLELHIPAVEILDWPDIPNRSIIWSYRSAIECTNALLTDMIELLSKIRINELYLIIDNKSPNSTNNCASLNALERLCHRHCVILRPMVVINTVDDTISTNILGNFTSNSIGVVFTYDKTSYKTHLVSNEIDSPAESGLKLYRDHLIFILELIKLTGFTSICLSSSHWIHNTLHPKEIVKNEFYFPGGVVCYDFEYMFPNDLHIKPICGSMHSYTSLLSNHALNAVDKGFSTIFYPIVIERDFIYPMVLLKFTCFSYGGLVWNRNCVMDMLGPDMNDMPLLQKVSCWLLFCVQWHLANVHVQVFLENITSFHVSSSQNGMNSEQSSSILSTPRSTSSFGALLGMESSNNVSQSAIPTTASNISASEVASSANVLTSLILSDVSINQFTAPSKSGTALCLKYAKKVCSDGNWKMVSMEPKSFFDFVTGGHQVHHEKTHKNSDYLDRDSYNIASINEYYSILHIISILCRVIIMGHNAYEKQGNSKTERTLKELFDCLPAGTKSDIANAFLEGLEYFLNIWKTRIHHCTFSDIDMNGVMTVKTKNSIKYIKAKYMNGNEHLVIAPNLPLIGVFCAISDNLAIAPSVQEALLKKKNDFSL